MNIHDYLDDKPKPDDEEKVVVNQPLIGVTNRKLSLARHYQEYLVNGGEGHSDIMNFIMGNETGKGTGNLLATSMVNEGISYVN